jgi:ParB/RepB/Spo0J family partition protein
MPAITTHPTAFFHPDPDNPRKDFPEEELRRLGQSLKKKQLVPLIARKSGKIVDGERRWRAATLVGVETLDTFLLEDNASPSEVKEIQLVTAMHRADLKPHEVYCAFLEWLRLHPGKGGKDLAAAIDRSEASVSRTLSLSRCIPAVQEAAAQGKLGLNDWTAISQVGEEQQETMLLAKLNGTSAEGLKRLRKQGGDQETVTVTRINCEVPGKKAKLSISGQSLSLVQAIEVVQDWLKEAKRAAEQGLSAKSFERVCRDKAKV